MPITELDKITALVLIDLQNGIVDRELAHPKERVLANARLLADAFREKGLPVVRVRVAFSADGADMLRPRVSAPLPAGKPRADWAEYAPEIGDDPRDIHIVKRQWGAFYGTELDLQLRRRGVTNIVLGGISTSIGVESTARQAFEFGYNQSFPVDAMTDTNVQAHENSVQGVFGRMGEVGTTAEVLELLAR